MNTNQKQKLKNGLLVLVVFLLFLFIIYKPNIIDGVKLTYTNLMYVFEPFKSWEAQVMGPWLSDPADNVLPIAFSSIHKGIFTFWLSNVGLGMSQSMSIYLFFMNYFYLLPLEVAQIVISVVKVSIAFLTMYLLMRRYKVSLHGSIVSGITYSVCSTMVMWQGWPHSEVTMLAPLLFLFMDLLLEKFSINYLVAASFILFSMLVAGMPTYVAYFMYLLGCYVLYYGIKNFWQNKRKLLIYFGFFCGIVVFATLLSMPYTIDLLSTVGGNGYNASRKELSAQALDWSYLRTLYFPYIRNDLSIHINEATMYTGVLAVVTFPLSCLAVKKNPKQGFYLVALAIITLTLFADIFYPIYKFLPLVNTSIRFRLIVLINFCLAINFGMTMDYLLTSGNSSKKTKVLQVLLLSIGTVLFIWVYRMVSELDLTNIQLSQVQTAIFIVIIFYSLSLLYIALPFEFIKKIVVVGSLLLVISDSALFAQNYLPGINAEAKVIPEVTDTIAYLQENTEKQEKIAPVGLWTFFASSNVYYDLRDVRGHNFVYTNEDMQNYYTAIDENVYTTPTRVAFQTIQNENLLKYMGVKYTVDTLSNFSDREASSGGVAPIEGLSSGEEIMQSFTATLDNLSAIQLFLGTYGQTFNLEETVSFTLTEMESGAVVAEGTQSLASQRDNDYLSFQFDQIGNSAEKQYKLSIKVNLLGNKQITFYQSNYSTYEGIFNNTAGNKNLVLLPIYVSRQSRIGQDNLVTTKLTEYSEQVQLTDTMEILSTEEAVLAAMKEEYKKTTAFFTQTKAHPEIANTTELSSDEKISEIQHENDGTLAFNVNVNEERVILINEYNDGNWSAYVDNEKVPVYKGNYLYRAIKVDKGNHQVVLKYENHLIKKCLIIMVITALCLVLLLIFRQQLEKFIEKFVDSKAR